ncbi:helix-turn-helix transcriptional regulator, partial [Hungatella hathewayi]|uniref:helix-turn-helix transcriptional regulator n=2 Tax=Lachnospiraceae TaxID=186803 RepID=UPI0011DCC400
MTFSERLILLRKQKGFSQEQLGAEVGVTRQTVSKWELGETTPEMDKLIKLAELFGITLDELAGREEK